MPKTAPTFGRLASMVIFALSCFGILAFLWISFGGPTPLKPQGFRFKAPIDEATLLVEQADVRMAGLNVGKVKDKQLRRQGGAMVEIEIDRAYAPIPANSRLLIRQKTLLGQLYLELTPGDRDAPKLAEGATLTRTQVQPAVEIDEIVRTFDAPTRKRFRGWVAELADTIDNGRGEDLNDAFGTLPGFAGRANDLFAILDEQEPVLQRLVKNTGVALRALNEREGQFRELIVNANDFFGALASRNDALAETISVFPTFLDESRMTLSRLENFSRLTRPLVQNLIPVADQLRPTLRDVGLLAPDLEQLFRDLDPLIDESDKTLPQLARILRGVEPVLESAHVYLPELNPILSFLNYQQEQVSDFIKAGGGSLSATLPPLEGEGPRHYLRQFSVSNARSLGISATRPNFERGNAYNAPNYLKRQRLFGIPESFDCVAAGGEKRDPENGLPPCFVAPASLFNGQKIPLLKKGEAPVRDKPQGNDGLRKGFTPGSGAPTGGPPDTSPGQSGPGR